MCIASVRLAILLFCDGLIAVFFVFAYSKLTVSFSTHRRFCLLSASYTIEICLERSDFGGRHFESVLAARPYLCDVISFDSEWVGKRKLCNGLILNKASLKKSAKSIFTSKRSMLSFQGLEHIWLKSSQPRVVVKKDLRKPF